MFLPKIISIKESITTRNPEIMYSEAINEFESENYDLAFEKFHDIELKFP